MRLDRDGESFPMDASGQVAGEFLFLPFKKLNSQRKWCRVGPVDSLFLNVLEESKLIPRTYSQRNNEERGSLDY